MKAFAAVSFCGADTRTMPRFGDAFAGLDVFAIGAEINDDAAGAASTDGEEEEYDDGNDDDVGAAVVPAVGLAAARTRGRAPTLWNAHANSNTTNHSDGHLAI